MNLPYLHRKWTSSFIIYKKMITWYKVSLQTNNIRFKWNFNFVVRTLRTCNQTIRFLKFIFNKNIEKKFEAFFFFKLVWKETSFHREREVLGFIKFFKKKGQFLSRLEKGDLWSYLFSWFNLCELTIPSQKMDLFFHYI